MPQESPPILYAATTGATPFRFNLHANDLGHTMIVGPSGAGKSTLLGLIASQWFRYPDAQVFAFDKGYSLYVLNRASGGEFYDVGGDKTHLAFYPLREIDTDQDLAWSVNWLEGLCIAQGMNVGPKHRQAITEAVQQLRLSPARTLTEFCAEVQDEEIRRALQYCTLSGPLGQLLDADRDVLGPGRFVTFETEMNAAVILSTQNLSDVFNSDIGDVIVETSPTKGSVATSLRCRTACRCASNEYRAPRVGPEIYAGFTEDINTAVWDGSCKHSRNEKRSSTGPESVYRC